MDMPVLFVKEPASASLQGHHSQCYPAGVTSSKYNDRIPLITTCSGSSNLSLCGGHVSGRGQSVLSEGILGNESELIAGERPRWTCDIRDHGALLRSIKGIIKGSTDGQLGPCT